MHETRESTSTGRARMASPVLLVDGGVETDHFRGVPEALTKRGIASLRVGNLNTEALVEHDFPVVVVKDTCSSLAAYALERARKIGARTVLLMDGVLEYRNTFENPFVEPDFLRPAPVDVVACAGESDAARLREWGNQAFPTGLPRLEAGRVAVRGAGTAVLVATARRAWFDVEERSRLLGALREIKRVLAGETVCWRIGRDLAAELGVERDDGPLVKALEGARGVITTPSTLVLEAMIAGVPVGIVHPHPGPLWQEARWVWRGDGSPEGFVRGLLAEKGVARSEAILAGACTSDGAGRLAELIETLLTAPGSRRAPERARGSLVRPVRPSRVVNMVASDGAPLGGVFTWAQRLARDSGGDVRTLVVMMETDASLVRNPVARSGDLGVFRADEHTDVCILDPLMDGAEKLARVTEALGAYGAQVVMPNYTDLCWMAALSAKQRDPRLRLIAVAHADEPGYRRLLEYFDGWDACVGVSAACSAWVRPMAKGRPVETVPCVPGVSAEPKTYAPPSPARPFTLGYFGRVVQTQKRVLDFVELMTALGRLSRGGALPSLPQTFELHVVGDGPDLAELESSWRRARVEQPWLNSYAKMILHGRQEPAWAEAFVGTLDVSVLVSEYEGTSVSMMEAMGRGVVPAVTAVASGASEWVRDGVNGVVAPVGDMPVLARRIAELARDRSLLSRLGRAAWETAKAKNAEAAVVRRYAELCARVAGAPAVAGTPGRERRLIEPWRWGKGWNDVPREVGGPPEIEDGARDVGIASEIEERVKAILREAVGAGARRLAVYGLGRHTRRMAGVFLEPRMFPFVGFIDDAPPPWTHAFGLPAASFETALDVLRPDAVLLSSDVHEEALWRKTEAWRSRGVRVLRVWGS